MGPLPVHHLAILVRDLGRSEAFYAGVLGLPVRTRHRDPAGGARSVWLELGGGAFLAIEKADEAEPRAGAGWHCVALAIARDDRDAWRARLEAAGHGIERETDFTIFTRDPDGALVGLSHYPDAILAC